MKYLKKTQDINEYTCKKKARLSLRISFTILPPSGWHTALH